jgi:branched-chain amino acid aminotransferase
VKVWLAGRLVEEADACIPPSDRGFLLGDGVFETLRCYSGKPFALAEHLERLAEGARAIEIEAPPTEELERGAIAVVRASRLAEARMRITLTSGSGPGGLARGEGSPTALITASPLRRWPPTASAVLASWARDEHSPLAGVKTTARVESVLAHAQARRRGADEALFLNRAGQVCEATTANVFVIRRGRVETPGLAAGCLAGITREHVLRLCAVLGVDAAEAELPVEALRNADELFLTSSTREIQPLVQLDGAAVGAGEAGPITRRLSEAYSLRVSELL